GRMEIMTPETGQEILQLLTQLKKAPGNQNAAVFRAQQRYGRFLAPMVREILQKHPNLWEPALEGSLKSLGLPAREGSLARLGR
ncbi:MAG TPA: hypothetical protein VMT78_03095, partial [Terriglobia bacterium]|nr:hypothetical protein [Terriglobia bacterium]